MRDRRTFLKRAGALGTAAVIAGCTGGGDGTDTEGGGGDSGDGDSGGDDSGGDSGGGSTETMSGDDGPAATFGGDGEINFNISPSVPQQQLQVQYAPLRDHIESYVTENYDTPSGLEASMNIGSNYSAVIQALGQGTADLAETGPLAAVVGNQTGNSEIILQRFGYGGWTYKSLIAVPNGSDISSVEDLEGKDVAFSDPLSTSGFLFPVAAMAEAGIDIGELPEGNGSQAAFTPRFAGGHVQSYTLLEQGQVDAAGMGGFVRDTSTGPTPDAWQDVATTLHEDSGIPRAPIVVSPQLPQESKDAIQQAFLEGPDTIYYGADGEEGTDDDLWFGDVREATIDDYQLVVDKAETLGIDPSFFE
ncbi:phosphate/phosphite/phosphonate ABC transporter substrate-binding protein [Salinirussus salinus]|jgi:phosphonate transport system substrate-binding protein|uniref:phosphate/phosphite/phosphonate ABC transporter substrate-binding protein n=1 Tax=Salinirussus salinus TaxID=1198300 RepID=UPI0013577FA9|nr:phosphate/phosphite/phosphonate ABC transporter substrate-binding protein [Salinirussus salinus]